MKRPSSLYVHIPFCKTLCAYCDFPKVFYKTAWAKSYLGALFSEIRNRNVTRCKTIYVGGGTPTSLEPDDLRALLFFLRDYLDEDYEFSIEANPETLDETKAKILAEAGVNRVSIGMQTASPRLLKVLGRNHGYSDVQKAVRIVKEQGIRNINVDLMYGLPEETLEEALDDVKAFLALGVPHVSTYSLILEQGTAFYAKGIKPLDDDAQQAQFERIRDALEEHGYQRYEVSNFARSGYQCRHNRTYWKDEPYYAAGLGASGYIGDTRYVNTKSLSRYLKDQYEGEIERLDRKPSIEDYFLTNLRLVEGFDPRDFKARFGIDFLDEYGSRADRLVHDGLLEVSPTCVKATRKGIDFLDTILVALF